MMPYISIMDDIRIGLAVSRANNLIRKERRAENRAAGREKVKNLFTRGDDNNTTNPTPIPEEQPVVNREEEQFATPPKNHPEVNVEAAKDGAVKPNVSKDKPKKEPAKTKEQEMAEAEAPVEEAGAEKISGNANVGGESDATMQGQVNLVQMSRENPLGAVDLSFMEGGINLDDHFNGTNNLFGVPTPPPGAARNPYNPIADLIPPEMIQQHRSMNLVEGMMMPQQPAQPPIQQFVIPNMVGTPGMAPQQTPVEVPPTPVVGVVHVDPNQQAKNAEAAAKVVANGRHKQDNPPVPKQKPPKAEPAKVENMDTVPNLKDGMEITNYTKKTDVRNITVLDKDDVAPAPDLEAIPPVRMYANFNNEAIKRYDFLKDIEQVAIDTGNYQLFFDIAPSGLVFVHVCDSLGKDIMGKGFTVDPGLIIDGSKKVYPGIFENFEDYHPFPLFKRTIVDGKSKHIFNEELIKSLIIGGNASVTDQKGLFSDDFLNTNKYVALITIPTRNVDKAGRKNIQTILTSMCKNGAFSTALSESPYARFRIADHNPATNTIILDTAGVPYRFGTAAIPHNRVQIKINLTTGKYKILKGDNLLPVYDFDKVAPAEAK